MSINETEFASALRELADRHDIGSFLFVAGTSQGNEMLVVADGLSKPVAIELLLRSAQSLADDLPGYELKVKRKVVEDGRLL